MIRHAPVPGSGMYLKRFGTGVSQSTMVPPQPQPRPSRLNLSLHLSLRLRWRLIPPLRAHPFSSSRPAKHPDTHAKKARVRIKFVRVSLGISFERLVRRAKPRNCSYDNVGSSRIRVEGEGREWAQECRGQRLKSDGIHCAISTTPLSHHHQDQGPARS